MTFLQHARPAAATIAPFFFQARARKLFAALHAPDSAALRQLGVVLCYPALEEQIRSHRSLTALGFLIAEAGYPALRFDYFGTGDSEGKTEDATLETWLDDVAHATSALRERTGVERFCLIGQRLGATLAVLAQERVAGVVALGLWEPVFDGREYLSRRLASHREWAVRSFADNQALTSEREAHGFEPSEAMDAALRRVVLFDTPPRRALNAFLISAEANPRMVELAERWQEAGIAVERAVIPGCEAWIKDRGLEKGMGVLRATRQLVAWLPRVES